MTVVKICGVRSQADAAVAVHAGATLVGFNFWPSSPRYIPPAMAARIRVPRGITRVGLFVDAPEDDVRRIAEEAAIELVQLHGNEGPAFCRRLGRPFMKAFRLKDETVLRTIPAFLDAPDHPFLVDAWVPGKMGGTGMTVRFDLARRARDLGDRCLLAGGLTEVNVAAAIAAVAPWGVDVASGVERLPGEKDPALVLGLLRAVAEADRIVRP